MALVRISAFNFAAFGRPVPGARIFALGSPLATLAVTDASGRAELHHAPGEEITLVIERPGFVTTQSVTLTVPPEGRVGRHEEITFQTMPTWFFEMALRWLRLPEVPGRRHLITTVTAAGKTLRHPRQGEPRAVVRMTRDDRVVEVTPIYLGILPLLHKTDLVSARWRRGATTSADGGVLLPPLELGTYSVDAHAPGRRFRAVKAVLREDSPALVNLSPPWGPRAL